ncbi:solute carrier family 46, member 1 [Elysia marginata]|uniref:Solute carrier family 46, member 1 n=1 Tax=Elysia marginata TaxID=1093978 RepID=A0AAV4JWI9_9GAST|nr:solute carrier family 46, member 1 [Elysia marginata]
MVTVSFLQVKQSVAVYVREGAADQDGGRRETHVLSKRGLCLVLFVLTVAVNFSRTGVEALFQLKYPLCWAATKIYTVNGLRIFFSWVAILLTLTIMQKIFKLADRHVAVVGIVSSVLSNAALAFAVNDAMVYEVAVVGFMTRSIIPMLRSVLSSLVGQANQGAMYSGLSCIESLGASVFSTIANRIYYATLDSWAGAIFLIFACIMLIALVLITILNILFAKGQTREDTYVVQARNIQEDSR